MKLTCNICGTSADKNWSVLTQPDGTSKLPFKGSLSHGTCRAQWLADQSEHYAASGTGGVSGSFINEIGTKELIRRGLAG